MDYVFKWVETIPCIDTPFCTNQYPESPVPMTRLSCLSKTALSSDPERRFGTSPNLNQRSKSQTGPSEHMHLPKKRTHLPWVHTPLQQAQNGLCASKWLTPLQRGVCHLQGGVCKVETYPQNHSFSILVLINHMGELTMVI